MAGWVGMLAGLVVGMVDMAGMARWVGMVGGWWLVVAVVVVLLLLLLLLGPPHPTLPPTRTLSTT